MLSKIMEITAKNAGNIIKIGLIIMIQNVLNDNLKKAATSTKDEAIKAARRLYNNIREKRTQASA